MDSESLTENQHKKLMSIKKRLLKVNKDIASMGFNVYLANSTCNIMDGVSHSDHGNNSPIQENIIMSIVLDGWDGGDW